MTDAKIGLLDKYNFLLAVAGSGRVSATAIAVLGACLEFLGADQARPLPADCFWTSERTLAERTGLARSAVHRAMAALLGAGVIHAQGGDRRGKRRNVLRVPFDAVVVESGRAPRLPFLARAGHGFADRSGLADTPGTQKTPMRNVRQPNIKWSGGRTLSGPAAEHLMVRQPNIKWSGSRTTTPFYDSVGNTPVKDSDSRTPVESKAHPDGRAPHFGSGKRPVKRSAKVLETIRRLDGLAKKHPDGAGFDLEDWLRLPPGARIRLGWAARAGGSQFVDAALAIFDEHCDLPRSRAGDIGVRTGPRPALRAVGVDPAPEGRSGSRQPKPVTNGPAPEIDQLLAAGWTFTRIADRLGVHPQSVRGWRTGRLALGADRRAELQALVDEMAA